MKAIAILGFALMIVSALLFVAGSPTIALLPRNYANFGGIAAGALGVLAWVIYAATRRDETSEEEAGSA